MNAEERFAEIDEEVAALHEACEHYEQAIELMSEMLTALAMAIPRQTANYEAAAERIDHILSRRDMMPGKPLGEISRRLAEQFRDDLRGFAAMNSPTPPDSPKRARFQVISGGRE